MHDSYQKIQSDLRQLKADVAAAIGGTSGDAGAYASLARERAEQKITELEQRLSQKGREVDAYVHEHTWTAMAVSAAVGLVMGLLFSARTRQRG